MNSAIITTFVKKHPLGIGCGVAALLFAGATIYRRSFIPEVSELLDQKTVESARIATNVKNARQLTEQLGKVAGASKGIEARLVHASELANNLQYFYRLEAETGTKILELRQNPGLSKDSAKSVFNGVSFTISVQGEYPAILELFRRLETGSHFCRVMATNIVLAGADRTSPLKLSLSVELLGQP